MQKPTKSMLSEVAEAGFYVSPTWADRKVPRIQLITVGELLNGKRIEYPPSRHVEVIFKRSTEGEGETLLLNSSPCKFP